MWRRTQFLCIHLSHLYRNNILRTQQQQHNRVAIWPPIRAPTAIPKPFKSYPNIYRITITTPPRRSRGSVRYPQSEAIFCTCRHPRAKRFLGVPELSPEPIAPRRRRSRTTATERRRHQKATPPRRAILFRMSKASDEN